MFRVPLDPDRPTFDHTFKVGFGRWLTSSSVERKEWMRRRNAAARLTGANQRQRIADRARVREEQLGAQRAARAAAEPVPQPAVHPSLRNLDRLARIQVWLASIELAAYVVLLLVILAICGGAVWLVAR